MLTRRVAAEDYVGPHIEESGFKRQKKTVVLGSSGESVSVLLMIIYYAVVSEQNPLVLLLDIDLLAGTALALGEMSGLDAMLRDISRGNVRRYT